MKTEYRMPGYGNIAAGRLPLRVIISLTVIIITGCWAAGDADDEMDSEDDSGSASDDGAITDDDSVWAAADSDGVATASPDVDTAARDTVIYLSADEYRASNPNAPGTLITDPMATGDGDCDGVTLQWAVDRIRELSMDLKDINTLVADAAEIGGNLIYPFVTADGAFAIAMVREWTQCIAATECHTNYQWYYFQTNVLCVPERITDGAYTYDPEAGCYHSVGTPYWGCPEKLNSNLLCNK